MTTRTTVPTFRLDGDLIVQEPEGTRFDPKDFGAFTRGSLVVRACRIPRPFKVGAEICKDGYLVYDGRLFIVSSATFTLDYKPLNGPKPNPEDADVPGEWQTAA